MIEHNKLVSLVTKSQKGDDNALNELMNLCYEGFYYFALKSTGNAEKALEATQNACVEILKTLKNLKEPSAFITWSQRIIYHQCIRYQPKQPVIYMDEEDEDGIRLLDRIEDDDITAMPEAFYEEKEFQKTIQDLLNSLPPEQCSALMLYYYEKLSIKQIADIQDTNEGTVKSRLNYGRKAIKKKVEEYEKRTGLQLHGASIIPALLFSAFKTGASTLPTIPALPVITGGAMAATGISAGTAASAGAAVATTAAKAIGISLTTKIIAGVVAAVTIAGTAVGAVLLTQKDSSPAEDEQIQSAPTDGSLTEENEAHTHTFVFKDQSDSAFHELSCICGATKDEIHNYENGFCPVCQKENPYNYYLNTANNACEILNTKYSESRVSIPATIDNIPVTAISERAFQKDDTITELYLPSTMETIGDYAFSKCSNLTTLVISDGITAICMRAFNECTSLINVTIPKSVTIIKEGAFVNCHNLKEITYEGTLNEWRKIEQEIIAFSATSLSIVRCSDGISYENLEYEVNADGKTCTVTRILLDYDEIYIPAEIEGCRVTRVGSNNPHASIFNYINGSVRKIIIEEGILEIGDHAFADFWRLESVELPKSLTKIGDYAFSRCTDLTQITLPASVTHIGECAFEDCKNLTEIFLPESITVIEDYALSGCKSLKTISLPAKITKIESGVFAGCTSLSEITIPQTVTYIGEGAFAACTSLSEITIPQTVTYIGGEAFARCTSLTEIVIPDGVTVIGEGAFDYCQNLTQITLPASVTHIGECVFQHCKNLSAIKYKGTTSQWNQIEFGSDWNFGMGNYTVYCQDGTVEI